MKKDLISRQAAINVLEELKELDYELYIRTGYSHLMEGHWDFVIKRYKEAIKETPCTQQKQGHWIANDDYDGEVYYTCSRCEEPWVTIDGTPQENRMKYCPHCGAKMESEKE